jgi:hypothetical protein
MLVAGAMVAPSIFFVFRPLQPSRIQPAHPTLAARGVLRIPKLARSLRNTVARNHDPTQTWSAAGEFGHTPLKRDRGPRQIALAECVIPAVLDGGRLAVISPATIRLTSPYLPKWEKSNVDNDEQQLPVHRKQGLWPG